MENTTNTKNPTTNLEDINNTNLLERAKLLNIENYNTLSNPIYVKETTINNNQYWVVVKSENKLYKIHLKHNYGKIN